MLLIACPHCGLRQDEVHVVGGGKVARQRGGHRADLLEARQHQEGRRPPVALDADRVEAGLGVGHLAVPVRLDRAAGVQVRVDQRPQRPHALQPGIEVDAQLPREGEVGALPGRGDDPVHRPEGAWPFRGDAVD